MEPKRHHYVSQFYLAHWTPDRSKTSKLVVTAVDTGTQRPGTPKGEANVKNLYTIEDRENPLIIEKMFSEIEDKIAPLIRSIEEQQQLPSEPEEMVDLLDWIALQHQKVLRMREVYENFYDQLGRTLVQVATQSDQVFEQVKWGIERDGTLMDRVSRADLAAGIPDLKFRIDATTLVQQILDGASVLSEVLPARNWALLVAPTGSPSFITSDNPVCLVPMRKQLIGVPLGFAIPGTCVLYALTPRLAMSGTFEEQPSRIVAASRRIASFNGLVLQCAERYVYSDRTRIYHEAGADIRWTCGPRSSWHRNRQQSADD